jgi:hypothetical protein
MTMSVFEHLKPTAGQPSRDALGTLRATLERLEAEQEETPQMIDLKRILAGRIAEMERRNA